MCHVWFQLDCADLYWSHAFGDQYRATDFVTKGKGKLIIKFEGEDGNSQEYEVYDFKGDGVALAMYNTDESIRGFAHACF
jgi:isocitrate dehydrogenase